MKRDRIKRAVASMDARLGPVGAACVSGAVLLLLAAIYVTPEWRCINHGADYARLAAHPFDWSARNPMQLRILSPLLAHLMLLRGHAFVFFPLLTAWLFLALTYAVFRRKGFTAVESLGMAALMAFSTTTVFTLHFSGYTDTLSYLLLLLCLATNGVARSACYALALLNHESNLFALPGLLLLEICEVPTPRSRWSGALMILCAVIPFLMYRSVVHDQNTGYFTSSHYLSATNILFTLRLVARYAWLGVFASFKLLWVLPILGLAHSLQRQSYARAAWFAVVPISAAAQLVFATDTSRLMGLAFPSILLGAQAVRAAKGSAAFASWLWTLIGLNLLVPTYYVGGEFITPLIPLPISLVLWLCGVDPWGLWWGTLTRL